MKDLYEENKQKAPRKGAETGFHFHVSPRGSCSLHTPGARGAEGEAAVLGAGRQVRLPARFRGDSGAPRGFPDSGARLHGSIPAPALGAHGS